MSVPTAPKRGGGRNGDVQLAGKQGVAENVVNWAIDEDFLENYMTMLPANLSEDGDDDIDDIYDQQTASVPQDSTLGAIRRDVKAHLISTRKLGSALTLTIPAVRGFAGTGARRR
eukprot:5366011-Pyramimonas_sp.AAC.1